MKNQKEKYQLDQFEDHINLWNIVPGGSGKGIVLLRNIVDAIQRDNYCAPGSKIPVILIAGATGKRFTAVALANSLAIEDIRVCPAGYFDNGYYSHQLFSNSYTSTAHIITNYEALQGKTEATLWKYISNRECSYFNTSNREYDNTVHCNGLIVLTARNKKSVSNTIMKAIDYTVELEPHNHDLLEAIIHQRLIFCGIDYEGDEVLRAIVNMGLGIIELVIPFLKKCIMIMKADLSNSLTMEIVRKASWLSVGQEGDHDKNTDDMPL